MALLIEQSADLNPVNNYQSTPLDSTYADWKHVIGAAKFIGVTVERKQWEKGRLEARELLLEKGGKRKSELK